MIRNVAKAAAALVLLLPLVTGTPGCAREKGTPPTGAPSPGTAKDGTPVGGAAKGTPTTGEAGRKGPAGETGGPPAGAAKGGPSGAGGGPAGGGAAGGPPPAPVVLAEAVRGEFAPEAEYVGTLYYPEVSEVAAEVAGSVREVFFDEGRRVGKGDVLVRLDDEILGKTIDATRSGREQVLADLEKAQRDLKRTEALYKEEAVGEKAYDESRFQVQALGKRADALAADLSRLEAERARKTIRSPFAGIVVRRHVERGEWLAQGGKVSTVARDDRMDAVVEVPGDVLPFVRAGMRLAVSAGGREMAGPVDAIVPRGEVATRTFPVKVRVANPGGLVEGMEARVRVPAGRRVKALVVPRDALVPSAGSTVVFTVAEGKAKSIPVTVVGYAGRTAAVEGAGLSAGTTVVVKGNERLREGQPVAPGGGGPGVPAEAGRKGP